jgi:uncharacterized membrane protein YbhN (UPF0104 family)
MCRPLRHSLFLLATARAVVAGGKRLSRVWKWLSAFHRFREKKNKNLDKKKKENKNKGINLTFFF